MDRQVDRQRTGNEHIQEGKEGTEGKEQVPYAAIGEYWNSKAPLQQAHAIKRMTAVRRRHLAARWEEAEFRENWKRLIDLCAESQFLTDPQKFAGFGFDWVIKNDTNYIKVLEGNYNREATARNIYEGFDDGKLI